MKETDRNSEKFILFQLGETTYALPARHVQQMEMIEDITPVPNAPPHVDGVVFTRGQVIPAINLRARFGFERVAHTPRSRLIVAALNGRVIGLVADSAREFMSIPLEDIQPPPDGVSGLSGNYLRGVVTLDNRIILIVDLNELIGSAETRAGAART
ncbi:MAG TPA: chemotaxis protein CheW [Terriglobia bacterium]|jgi:purine-binding chemotaxis protein CheW